MSAKDVDVKAQKKAKNEGKVIRSTGKTKTPTKDDNMKFILGDQGKKKEEKKKKEESNSDSSDNEVQPEKKKKEKERKRMRNRLKW